MVIGSWAQAWRNVPCYKGVVDRVGPWGVGEPPWGSRVRERVRALVMGGILIETQLASVGAGDGRDWTLI